MNPNKPVQTRCGYPARILTQLKTRSQTPLVVVVDFPEECQELIFYYPNGRMHEHSKHRLDLVNVPGPKIRYANVYKECGLGPVYETLEQAVAVSASYCIGQVKLTVTGSDFTVEKV